MNRLARNSLWWLAIAAASFYLGSKITFGVRTQLNAGVPWVEALDGWSSDLTNLTHLSLHRSDLLGGTVATVVVGLVIAYQLSGRKNFRRGEEHGSAKWGKPSDIKPFINKDYAQNLLFTKTERLSLDGRQTQRNLNALVIGGSGSGKSRYFVLPNLAQQSTSVVVTDPKGELLASAGTQLAEAGYKIRCLNLIDFAHSDSFNPLAYFNPNQAEVDTTILTQNIMANTTGRRPTGGNDFWEKAERALLNALVAFAYFTNEPGKATLVDVIDLLARMQASEENEDQQSEIDLLFEATEELIAECEEDPEAWPDEVVTALEGLRFACSQYRTYTQGAGETKKSVIISLGVRMAPLHISSLRRILSSDTIQAARVGEEKTALFLVIPDSHETFSFLVSIFYELMFEKLLYVADHSPQRRCAVPVQCFMDEFANIGKMPSFERKIAVMRSRGISTAVILQSFSQGKALYKDEWETVVGNCDSLLFLGGNEKSTTEFVSQQLGKETIDSLDTSESRGTSGSYSMQYRSLGRELLTPDELGRLPTTEAIYRLRGLPPFRGKKLDCPSQGNYQYQPAQAVHKPPERRPAPTSEPEGEWEITVESAVSKVVSTS